MSVTSPLSGLVNNAVKKASNSLTRDFNELEKLQSSVKDYKGFVAAGFSKVERELKKELAKVRPDWAFKEVGKPAPKGAYFVISPLDGIDNFARAIPYFALSVCVCNNGDLILSAVYNPITDELFFAEKGKGAYKEGQRNAERLRVSGHKDFGTALVATNVSYKKNVSDYLELNQKIVQATGNVRTFGAVSLDLANLAAGKLDAVLSLSNRAEDIMAALLIVKEAGGYVYDISQKDLNLDDINLVLSSGDVFAVNASLNKKVFELLHK